MIKSYLTAGCVLQIIIKKIKHIIFLLKFNIQNIDYAIINYIQSIT